MGRAGSGLRGFVEVAGGEVSGCRHGKDVSLDVGADGFEEVEGEAVAVLVVGVDDAHAKATKPHITAPKNQEPVCRARCTVMAGP